MAHTCKLNITVKSISIHSNGQPPLQLTPGEIKSLSNAITATILWPSSNQSSVVGAVAPILVNSNNTDIKFDFDASNPDGAHPPDPAHPASRLYRYLVLDDTDGTGSPLYIDVTETVKASSLESAFLKVLGSALGAAGNLVPGGQVATGAIAGLTSSIGDWITNLGKDSVNIIGSAMMQLHADQLLADGSKDYTLDLKSGSKPISQSWLDPTQYDEDGDPGVPVSAVLIPANSINGSITLNLTAFPLN